MNFSEILKHERNNQNLTMSDLAKKTNIAQAYISQLESGSRLTPTIRILRDIADGLDISLIYILDQCGYLSEKDYEEIKKPRSNATN